MKHKQIIYTALFGGFYKSPETRLINEFDIEEQEFDTPDQAEQFLRDLIGAQDMPAEYWGWITETEVDEFADVLKIVRQTDVIHQEPLNWRDNQNKEWQA